MAIPDAQGAPECTRPNGHRAPALTECPFHDTLMQDHLRAHRKTIELLTRQGRLDIQRGPGYQINRLCEPFGTGFSDFYDFGRIALGRGRFALRQTLTLSQEPQDMVHLCGINIVIRGRYQTAFKTPHIQAEGAPGQVWLRRGHFGHIHTNLGAGQRFAMLSLDFSPELLARFAQTEAPSPVLAFFQDEQPGPAQVRQLHPVPARLLGRAAQLLDLPAARDAIDLLELEGAALGLLGLLLRAGDVRTLNQSPLAWRTETDRAIDATLHILSHECAHKITIAQLARRVGLNECDLKRAFRQRTGKTIAVWLRERRMALALALLEEGCTLAQAAVRSGYASTRYFVQVFQRHFGYSPAEAEKSEKIKNLTNQ